MLALAIQYYVNPVDFPWQIPILAGFLLGWLVGCPWLLQRLLKRVRPGAPTAFRRCVLTCLLSGGAAFVLGALTFLLVRQISKAAESTLPYWIGAIPAAPVATAAGLAAMRGILDAPMKGLIRAGVPALALMLALGGAAGAGCALPAMARRAEELNIGRCRYHIARVNEGVRKYEVMHGAPPADLQAVLDKGYVEEQYLKCPQRKRDIGYFYYPARTIREKSQQLRLCDFADNHPSDGRNVVFTDGRGEWAPPDKFEKILQAPENADFAKKLREAEMNPPSAQPRSPVPATATAPAAG